MIPEHFTFKYLKGRVSIAAVLQDKGLDTVFRKRADQLVGPCPLHGGDNPNAFVISLSKNIWHCALPNATPAVMSSNWYNALTTKHTGRPLHTSHIWPIPPKLYLLFTKPTWQRPFAPSPNL
jgi:hypothetical protein